MARVGTTLGAKYALRRELGRGGMGAVYAAENTWTGRTVAVKTLRADYAKNASLLERFWQEARAASRLRHPNVVDVLDVGLDDVTGEPFIVQEFLEGDSFEMMLERSLDRRIPPEQALLVLLPVMEALDACHRVSIVHRDVKPSNIFLAKGADGALVPKLIDFGVSKPVDRASRVQTDTGVTVGTPQYMSPEQARGERDVDLRADVWAMGATLYEALAGRLPYEGPSIHVIVAQILNTPPAPLREVAPDVPEDLAAVIDRALAHDRRKRTPTMREFIDGLLRTSTCRSSSFRLALQGARAERTERAGRETVLEAEPLEPSLDLAPAPAQPPSPRDVHTHPEVPPPVEVPPPSERADVATVAWARPRGARRPAWLRGAAFALVPVAVALALVAGRALRPASPPPSATRAAPAAPRPPDPPPQPTAVTAAPPVAPEAVAVPSAPPPLAAPPPAAPPRHGPARVRRAPAPAVPAPAALPPPAPPVEAPRPAAPRDPLAPDETPYEQIRRRSSGR